MNRQMDPFVNVSVQDHLERMTNINDISARRLKKHSNGNTTCERRIPSTCASMATCFVIKPGNGIQVCFFGLERDLWSLANQSMRWRRRRISMCEGNVYSGAILSWWRSRLVKIVPQRVWIESGMIIFVNLINVMWRWAMDWWSTVLPEIVNQQHMWECAWSVFHVSNSSAVQSLDDVESNCSCHHDSRCVDELAHVCPLSMILYPRRAVVIPFTFFLFHWTRSWTNKWPNFVEINGTVRCRDALVTVIEKRILFDINWSAHLWTIGVEHLFIVDIDSVVRLINLDVSVWSNSTINPPSVEIGSMNCASEWIERFLLSAVTIKEKIYVLFFVNRSTNEQRRATLKTNLDVPFRSHCDTFSDRPSTEDENLLECEQWLGLSCRSTTMSIGSMFRTLFIGIVQMPRRNTVCSIASLSGRWNEHRSTIWPIDLSLSLRLGMNLIPSFVFRPKQANKDSRLSIWVNSSIEASIVHEEWMKEILSNNVPNLRHCWRDDYRCPRRSDDDVCCSREHRPSNCFDANDFVCFDRRCVKGGRCNAYPDCLLTEDEYICD